MSDAALAINRRNTLVFIAGNLTVVTLVPYTRTRTTSGGFKEVAGSARSPQVFRLIQQSRGYPRSPSSLGNGDGVREAQYTLLGAHDAAVAVGDRWTDPMTSREWEVRDIRNPNGYEVRAVVTERGR